MKLYIHLLAFFLGMVLAHAEPVLYSLGGTPSCSRPHILTVAQIGSEVHVSGTLETLGGITCFAIYADLYTSLELDDYPAIALKQVKTIHYLEGKVVQGAPVPTLELQSRDLYTQGTVRASYDPAMGSGWAETESLGRVWMRSYPWIYQKDLGWLFCAGGRIIDLPYTYLLDDYGYPVEKLEVNHGAVASGLPIKTLGFWLWSAEEEQWIFRFNPPNLHAIPL